MPHISPSGTACTGRSRWRWHVRANICQVCGARDAKTLTKTEIKIALIRSPLATGKPAV